MKAHQAGGTTIEFAAVMTITLAAATAALDVYAYQRAQAGAARVAQLIGDYVAHQANPHPPLSFPEIRAFGEALRGPEIGSENAMVVRLTALHQGTGAGSTPTIPWVQSIGYGDPAVANGLAARCPPREPPGAFPSFGEEGNAPVLPDGLTLEGGADLVTAQVCVRLLDPGIAQNALFDETIYRIFATPFRHPATRPPAAPTGRPQGTDS